MDVVLELFPEMPKIDEGYKLVMSKCGDTFHKVDTFSDGTTFSSSFKYDVETPFMGKLYYNGLIMFKIVIHDIPL